MEELFRDQIWQFYGVVIAAIGVIVAIVIYLLQRNKKTLSYQILTETRLLSVDEEIKSKLEITYEGMKVNNVSLIIIEIKNDGNQAITSSDFEKQIIIGIRADASVLSAEVTSATPKDLNPKINIDNKNEIVIEPLLLNKNDSFIIKMIILDYLKPIEISARIVGVKKLKRISRDPAVSLIRLTGFMIIGLGVGIFLGVLLPELSILVYISLLIVGMIFIAIGLSLQFRLRKERNKE